ncbi:glucose 1-dehydrogenase [Parafrankia irregularis]|uniref:Glucose 1-dehydrogenase n=1 Tax=Parafrankia irregularis TaxID=795642 RepID=A0A0S4QYT8_9ACTN|nr:MULTISPECIES: SDR family oxidoreductase [Parafrankia]MBE3201446.1 SDR family oxidoreductase [Parafrankia sp. CH37]CUU60319.1 glucose 1-dehydrogenase [Parafrankia irregularis]
MATEQTTTGQTTTGQAAAEPIPGSLLAGKVALVVGGTQGIGIGIARAYLAAGARVAVAGRDKARMDAVVEDLASVAGPANITGIQVDVLDVAANTAVVQACVAHFGGLDIFAAVAGVFRPAELVEVTEADFDAQIDLNLKGTFFGVQAAARYFLADRRPGKILTVSSVAGRRAFPGSSVYGASKAAVEHLTKVFAGELAPQGINVNCLVPGSIETPTNWLLNRPGAAEESAAATPARRNGLLVDMGAAAVYLSSGAADFVHGTTLVVDGGVAAVA